MVGCHDQEMVDARGCARRCLCSIADPGTKVTPFGSCPGSSASMRASRRFSTAVEVADHEGDRVAAGDNGLARCVNVWMARDAGSAGNDANV